uniref:phosphatase domain-containing protein n=1 Tax=Parerythrobacter lutipelagi TaxID=1964208 RepID=UPI0010F728E3|nr:phosphatase domain-containing protein [Parerythrobacter lutipelagi]
MPFRSDHPVRIQPYYGYRSTSRLVLSARALRTGVPRFNAGGRWQAFRTMVAQFASREEGDLDVELGISNSDGNELRHKGRTDREGFVHFDIPLEHRDLPSQTSWETVAFYWRDARGEQCAEGFVLAPATGSRLGVISDIDDTIIETGITGGPRSLLRNWRRVLAEMPDERLQVPGADHFYGALGGARIDAGNTEAVGKQLPGATERPFFYVSSSPWNLFSYLVAFKKARGLPLGPIKLRDWGLNAETFGSGSHGSHKTDAIRDILAHYPDMKFALVGDDSQGDLIAFGEIVEQHPQRIAAVFIRQAGEAHSAEEIAARAAIEASDTPFWTGSDYATGQAFLREAGLAQDSDAEKIVEIVEQAGNGATQT